MKKLTKSLAVLTLAIAATLHVQAVPITTADPGYLGSVTPGKEPSDGVNFINALLGMTLGASQTIGVNDYVRSGNTISGGLALAVDALDETGGNAVTLGAGHMYLSAKYDADGGGTLFWYVGNLTGTLEVPTSYGNKDLSNFRLYTASNTSVPDGGFTLGMLGIAMAGLAGFRRKLNG